MSDDPMDGDHNITSAPAEPIKRKRRGYYRVRTSHDDVVDLRHALQELTTAFAEVQNVPSGLNKNERAAVLCEPMSRLNFVIKSCVEVMRRNGCRPEPAR